MKDLQTAVKSVVVDNSITNGIAVISTDNVVETMSSLEIAALTSKRHSDVVSDIKRILKEAGIEGASFSAPYKMPSGQTTNVYNLPRRECDLIVSGYDVKYRLAIIDRWHELEKQVENTRLEQLAEAQLKLAVKADYVAKLEAANKRLTHPSVRNNNVMTVNVKGKKVTKKTLSYVEPPALVFEVDLDCPVLTKAELAIEFNVSEYTIYHVLSECNYTDCTGQPQSVAKGHYVIMEGQVYWSQSLMWRLLLKKGVLRPDEIVKYRDFKRTQGIFVPTSV
jgi:phage regulator Rha-like protein